MNGPSQNSGVPSFGHFLEYLRLKKFNVGFVHYFRVQQVFDKLGEDLRAKQPEYLKSILCPIFATSKEEQRRFSKVFDDYVEYCEKSVGIRKPREGGERQGSDRSKVEKDAARGEAKGPDISWRQRARRTIDHWRRKLGPRGIAAILLGVATVGAIVGLWILKPDRGGNFNAVVTEPSPNSTTDNTGEVAASPKPSLPTPTPFPPPPTPSPATTQKPVPPPLFYLAIVVVFLLLLLLIAVLRRRLRALEARSYQNKKPLFKWPLRAAAPVLKIYDTEEFRRASRLLRRRQIDEFFRLDIGATVSATIRSLGYPSFRYVPATRVPEYLALIERSSAHDHQARLFDEMVKALRRDGVVVTRYFYGDDPRVCCDERGRNCIRLERLKQRHAGHRLLLFGTGEQMLDPVTGRLAERTSFLSDWHERAVLTPESNWGWREQVLSEKFAIVRANVEGLATLVNYFESPAARSSVGWPRADPHPLPAEVDNPRAIDAVRGYLGAQTFQWLCACAVYPELRWELTLLLGSLPSMSKGVVKQENLLRLSRLPWFRKGAIPDIVRSDLIAAFEPARRDETRTMVVRLMETNPAPPPDTFASDLYRFELALQRWLLHDNRENLRDLRGALRRLPPRQVSRSEVAANLLKAVPHRFLGHRLPGMFYRRGLPALGVSTFVNVAFALVVLAAMLVAIRARAEQIPEWAYSPLLAIAPTPSPSATPTPAESTPTATPIVSPNPTPNATVTVTPVPTPTTGPSPTPISSATPDNRPASVSSLSECPPEGSFGSDGAQNMVKNRIDKPSNAARLGLDIIGKMSEPPTWEIGQERSQLQAMGEGRGAQVTGYLLAARRSGPESCNCRLTAPDDNDFHLVLTMSPSADEITSVTAEMTPRNRPPAWTLPNVRQMAVGKYVRVTGWLFLDTDHVRGNRIKRASNWEIHPVTTFEICNSSRAECDSGKGWVRLEDISVSVP